MGLHTIRLYLEPNPDGVYTVTSPDVPGLVTEGQTPDEVQANVQEALEALIEAWKELGRDLAPRLSNTVHLGLGFEFVEVQHR